MFRKNFLSMVLLLGLLISQSVPPARAETSCDHAQFISDLTAPDGSSFAPGGAFTKTWRLMNIGSCTWTTAYNLVWVGGDSIGAPPSVKLPVDVPPGQMADVSVNLTAPTVSGHYRALFKISNAAGAQFGIGDSANDPFWADINVVETNATIYDFVANAQYAQWKSGAGILPYPGTSGDSRGFAYQVNTPHLEDDSLDSSPGLFMAPQNKFNGYIQATFPEFQIQQGDHLQTLVNCEFGATGCYVTFRIDYLLPNGAQRTLWSWKEAYDKRFYRANLDLSSLAGQKVRFVFMLLSSGFASGDRAIWGSPRIVRTGTTQPPAPPPTLTPLPPLPPTATPVGQPPPTVAPSGCDRAAFVTDATVPDGTVFSPGAAFTKTWRLKNTGSCAWTTAYKLIYYSGEQMGPSTAVNLPWNAAYGQTVDISVNLVAPTSAGKYRGFWILANASGQFFGIGADAAQPIWVEINVAGDAPVDTGYDFTTNVCSAEWKSTVGTLPCPGTDGNSNGFVLKLDAPKLEDGSTGAPGLLTVPQNRYNGYIQGFYPTFTVQPGDKFQTTVGCEYGAACYLTYRLDYMTASGYIGTFWQWREQNEGKVYNASLDLSPLAGRSVRFILTILATGSATNDRAIWGSPRIIRTAAVTPIPPTNDWLTYTNSTYGFQFKYPPQAQISNQTNSSLRMDLPFTQGTNLREKYLEMAVRENVNPCRSPLSDTSPPGSPETVVVINGISFLKQVGGDAGVGHLHEWVGYSTLKGNACLSMDFVLHSLNAGNYATPPPVFDKAAESVVFTQMMETFGWSTPPVTTVPPPVVVSSPQINKLFMIDAANGWAIGNSYILRTMDGGATWYNVSAPGVTSVANGFFPNASKGWVIATSSAPYLFRTSDGGLTWTTYSIPFNGGYIQFLDDANGFVLSGQGIGMQKFPVTIYQTSDGGVTWTLKFAHDPNLPDNGLPLSGYKAGMTFRDASTGWIGGESPAYGIYLYKTMNSAVNWSQQLLALPAGYETAITSTTAPVFFGANDAILPVWLSSGVGTRNLFTYVTHDGGNSWGISAASAPSSYNADFVSVRDGFSWDPSGVLYVTNNSGTTWTAVTPDVNFGDGVRAFDFVSTSTGWVLDSDDTGNMAFYRTTDGGHTWTKLFGNAAPPAPQQLPDLTITQMKIELQNTSCLASGDQMGVRVWVKNNGNSIASSFVVRVNGVDQTANMLGIGETTILFFPGYNNPVTAIVDATNTNQESDENNNARSEMVAVPTPPLPCVVTPAQFAQSIVDKLNARNFDALPAVMDQTFGFAYWESQGTSYPSDQAIQSLRTGLTVTLIPDPSKDLNVLLSGLNPYAIMGLDPAKSYALFVSGWGSDSNAEAILYMTQRADGSLYWHSVLVAPNKFIHDTPTPTILTGPFAVTGVAPNDVLNIRAGAGTGQPVVGSIPGSATNVMRTGPTANADNATWVEVQNPSGGTGWVNSLYLTEFVSHDAFCADGRIQTLLEQLKGSMNQSNGDMFAALVSPAHGVDVRLWAYHAPVNFNTATARAVFTSTDVYQWGSGPVGGTEYGTGTFSQIIQPRVLEVFNTPTMETYCDNLTKVYPLATPWPYTNIRYYNLYKPASGATFDFRTWLIGFEYINNQPYLHSMVTIVWEP